MIYIKMMKSREKTLEARINYSSLQNIRIGQIVNFVSGPVECKTRIIGKRIYKSVVEMLSNENIDKLLK